MTPAGNAHLYPPPSFNHPSPEVRLVGEGFVLGRQFGIDSCKFGQPYVFARYDTDANWVLYAGPFLNVGAAEVWINALSGY